MPAKNKRKQKVATISPRQDHALAKDEITTNDTAETKEELTEQPYDGDLPEYERVRLENIRRNQDLDEHKPEKSTRTKRGISTKRHRVASEPVRRSTRHKGGDGAEPFVDTLEVYRQAAEAAAVEKWTRLPEDPISMQIVVEPEDGEEEDTKESMELPNVVGVIRSNEPQDNQATEKITSYMQQMQKLRLTEDCIAKVVKERGQSITFHPGSDKLIIVAGDKSGQLGIWNVDAQDERDNGVNTYQVHRSSIIHLEFLPRDHRKLLTMGYDSVFRLGDMEAEAFLEIHRAPEDMDEMFYSFCCLSPESDDLIYISRSDGGLSILDLRINPHKLRTFQDLHDRKINTVQVCPTDANTLITASLDQSIKLWDVRAMGSKKMKPLNMIHAHSKSVNCAFISPDGARAISVGLDDTIKLYENYRQESNATQTVRHNNQTGRWLTKFKPAWDPKQSSVFFMGSMERPRRAEMFHVANNKMQIVQRFSGTEECPVTAVLSLHAVHPTLFSFAGINSSGRVTVFR